ncbi:hypothetical protein MTP99_007508 [Tenebrio molitor]|nr:hypothetical protein MTP99_007508 [Tenebrio molitor]
MSYSGARSRHQAPHLLLNNQAIPKLQHIRYLGVTFSKIAPSTRTSKKPSKNPATEPTSCTEFESASETNTIPIQSRLKELQSRYVTRTLNSNNALAIQTLSTSFKYPSRDGRLLNRIPKIPKRKLKHPPTALLSPAYTDLPDDLQELVDSTPLTMR